MSQQRLVYIGSFTKDAGGEGTGISLARQDIETGALELEGVVAETSSPAFLAWSPDGSRLYAINEVPEASVVAYSVEPGTGALTPLGERQPTGGRGACHLTVHPSGRYVLTANYGSGHISVHPVNADGSVGERTDLVLHRGSGPNASRQEGPHAHHVRVDPSGKQVLAVDLG
ncbi:MAG TPA: beta-propeller fold lactonase family protein, partial [Actinopolymorphaceae bacterium]|nr:beta-propeller fold lactonase family protein [Actinopolymorphaceae bacterium]